MLAPTRRLLRRTRRSHWLHYVTRDRKYTLESSNGSDRTDGRPHARRILADRTDFRRDGTTGPTLPRWSTEERASSANRSRGAGLYPFASVAGQSRLSVLRRIHNLGTAVQPAAIMNDVRARLCLTSLKPHTLRGSAAMDVVVEGGVIEFQRAAVIVTLMLL